jgi:DNA-binding response OmpR family regulator
MGRERILIIEDDETLLGLYGEALNSAGYDVATQECAHDGSGSSASGDVGPRA